MIRIVFVILVCSIHFSTYCQKTEIQVRTGTGLFFFSGITPVARQDSYDALIRQDPYSVPYGRRSSLSVTIGGVFKYVSKRKILAGIGVEYQTLSSRSSIDSMHMLGDPAATVHSGAVDGFSALRVKGVCFSPFFGKRIGLNKMLLDITGGLEVLLILSNKEHLKMTGDSYSFNEVRATNSRKTDIRIHFRTEMNIRRCSIFAAYARGLNNYYPRYLGGQPEAYSHFIQAGIGYRLK